MDTLDYEEIEAILKLVEILLFRYLVIADIDRLDIYKENDLLMRVGT